MTADEARDRLYDTTFLVGTFWRRAAIKALAEGPDSSGVLALAQALEDGHPEHRRIRHLLRQLSPRRDPDKIAALWAEWAQAPGPSIAGILSSVGWPPGCTLETTFVRAVLAAATAAAPPEVLQAVAVLARALPVADESSNDGIYAAWIRCQSVELERLIDEQARQASSPALEALHALVTGRLDRYADLEDADGMLLVHAFSMAPEPFRARIARTVGTSPDRGLLENYRRALSSVPADAARKVENLKMVGDEDGLFEVTRSLRLVHVLDLCERWSTGAGRPGGAQQRAVVERALAAYRKLGGSLKVEYAAPLPDGLVDVFEWWRNEQSSDAQLRSDLDALDPFRQARALYLGREVGLVDDERLRAAAASDHWPQRLVARLLAPDLSPGSRPDHVFWVDLCAGDASLLQAPIEGTPEDYARHMALLGQERPGASRTRALLEILCAFQGLFVASGIVIDESAEATDRGAVEIEDAPAVVF